MTETPQPADRPGEPPNGPPSQPPHNHSTPPGDPRSETSSSGTGLPTGHHPPIPPGNPKSEIPNPQSFCANDLFTSAAPFEPGQYAMHGLLTTLFQDSALDREQRVRAVINRIRSEASKRPAPAEASLPIGRRAALSRRWSPFAHPRRWLLACTAAALLVGTVSFFWQSTPQAKADDSAIIEALKAGAGFFYFVRLADPFICEDAEACAARETAVQEAKAERDACLKAVEESKTFSDPRARGLWHSWQRYYEGLRDLGRRDECLAETQRACDYTLDNPTGETATAWYPVYLDGLANSHLRFGEYTAAREFYSKSIEVREAEIRRNVAKPGHEHKAETLRAQGLGPMYLRLTMLCLMEGHPSEARRWCDQAEAAMRDWMVRVCQLDRREVPLNASMWEAWNRLPEEFRSPEEPLPSLQDQSYWAERLSRQSGEVVDVPGSSMLIWTRAVFYHQAVLAVADEDYPAAEQAMDRAESIKDFPAQDELRLCFYIPLLRARLAILAHKDYSAALRLLDDAASKSGELRVPSDPNLNRLAISPARLAELHLLRGLALLGLEDAGSVGPPRPTGDGEVPAEPVGPVSPASAPGAVGPPSALDGAKHGQGWPSSDAGARIPSRTASTQPEAPAPSPPMTPRRAEALRLIERALATPEKLAAGLPAEQRDAFLSQFESWKRLAALPVPSTN